VRSKHDLYLYIMNKSYHITKRINSDYFGSTAFNDTAWRIQREIVRPVGLKTTVATPFWIEGSGSEFRQLRDTGKSPFEIFHEVKTIDGDSAVSSKLTERVFWWWEQRSRTSKSWFRPRQITISVFWGREGILIVVFSPRNGRGGGDN